METKKNYKAYIAGTRESKAFDCAYGITAKSAICAIKRRNREWRDCVVWSVYVHEDGQEEKIN